MGPTDAAAAEDAVERTLYLFGMMQMPRAYFLLMFAWTKG
jgi:hypothetical protein